MATTWVNFNNGDTGSAVRTAINAFNTGISADVSAAEQAITDNTNDISTHTANIDALAVEQTLHDARISDNTNAVTELQTPKSITFSDVTGNTPAYTKGQEYYAKGVKNIQGEYPDVTLQVGREMNIEVINNTGVTITNGSICRHNGVAGGQVQIVLALADTFTNANILGVATHDIPSGSKGLLTTFGLVGDVDTSTLTLGVPLYLSDTVAGAVTATPPEILSRIGGALTQDALTGMLIISIENNINLPTAIASLKGQNSPTYTLGAGVAEIVQEYTSEVSLYTITNTLAGTLSLTHAGIYELLLTVGGNISDEEIDITFELYDVTNSVIKETFTFNSGRASTPTSVPFAQTMSTVFHSLTVNTDYVIRLMSATNEVIVLNNISASLKSIQIT